MAMRVEKYSTSGDSVPAAGKILLGLRVIFCLLLVLFVSRKGNPVSTVADRGNVLYTGKRIRIIQRPVSGVHWPNGGHAFLRSDSVTYTDAAFNILHKTNFREPRRFSASQDGYITYKKVGRIVSAHDRSGNRMFRLKTRTYPRISRDTGFFFLITGDQSGIRVVDRRGRSTGGMQQVGSMITSYGLSRSGQGVYFGLISGVVEKYSLKTGKTLWRKTVGGSRIRMVKGISVSDDGGVVALLSGLRPERFSLLDSRGKLLWSKVTAGAVRTRVPIRVGRRFCAGYTDNGVYLLRRADGNAVFKFKEANTRGGPVRFLGFADNSDGSRTLLTWANRKWATAVLFDRFGRVLGSLKFHSAYAFPVFSKEGGSFSIQTEKGLRIFTEGEI